MAAGDARNGGARPATSWALEQIAGLIGQGSLGPGQQLPVERNLALQLGVSRGSVREATSALAALGVLEPRHGAGVFVTALDPDRLLSGLRLAIDVADEESGRELLDVHACLDGMAAGLAAARADVQQVSALRELAAAIGDGEGGPEPDQQFHRALAEAGGNGMLAALAEAVLPMRTRRAVWRAVLADGVGRHLAEHEELLAAVASGDSESARHLAVSHVLHSRALLATAAVPDVPAFDGAQIARPAARVSSRPVPREAAGPASSVTEAPGAREVPGWYRDAKLGIMIHWGLYAIPGWAPLDEALVELLTDDERVPHDPGDGPDPVVATPFAEWYQNGLAIEGSPTWQHHQMNHRDLGYADFRAPFERAVAAWRPQEWAELAAGAGARYVVPVAKHHDGYLMWPSATRNPRRADWKTPRDVVGELAAAARAAGLRLGVYYSGGMDWTFSGLPVRRLADVPGSCPESPEYAAYVAAHWRELIDRYAPSILWNDMGHPRALDPLALFEHYYRQVPDGVVTDRFGASRYDIATPNYARRHVIDARPWEGVRPIGLSFGWNRQEGPAHTLTGTELIHVLIDVVSKNGNLLLGISPDDQGRIPAIQQASLRVMGDWLKRHGEAIYGSRPWTSAESAADNGLSVRFTTSGDSLYVFILGAATGTVAVSGLHLPSTASVRDVTAAARVPFRPGARGSVLELPPQPHDQATVLRIQPCPPPLTS